MAASASDAHPFCIYNARYRLIAPLLDADGDLVTGASTPDSEISQDTGTFADATNEMTEIATSSGVYYLDLIATETDTKSTAVIMKSATAGMKTTVVVLYPKRLPVIRTGTAQAGAASTITLDANASAITDYYVGCYVNITNDSPANARGQARKITAYNGSTKVATVEGTYGTNPSSASTFEILATEDWIYRFGDLKAIAGDEQSATDLKDFADAGYDPATNKVQGVLLTDTVTTYTGNTPQTGDSFARLGAPAGASHAADIAAVKGDTAATLADTGTDGVVVAAASKTGYALSAAGVQAIWDALTAALTTVGSIGKLLVDNINATISSRLASADITLAAGAVTVGTNNDKTGYALTAGERNSVADAMLDRNMATGTDSGSATVRTMRQALRFLRNKWSISGTTLTVTKEDDTTASWTSTVTTSAGADPVTANDPADA